MKVSIGTVHGEDINSWYFHMMMGFQAYLREHGNPEDPLYIDTDEFIAVRSGPALAMGRGTLVGAFLERTTADALVMLDADMSAPPSTIASMIDAFARMRAEYDNVGVLGGLAFISNDPRHTAPQHNIWIDNPQIPGNLVKMPTYEPDTLYKVAATGGACVIVAREVLEKLTAEGNPFHHLNLVNYPMLARNLSTMDDIPAIEDMVAQHVQTADQLGEDLSFCTRVRQAGYDIYVHTGLQFDHAKSTLVGVPEYDLALKAQEAAQEAQ